MTVYRALDFLQKNQLIHRIASQNSYTACETPEHDHHAQLLLCEKCGNTEEVSIGLLEKALQKMAKLYHFMLSEKPMEIVGTCRKCLV